MRTQIDCVLTAGDYDEARLLDGTDYVECAAKGFKKDAECISKYLAPHIERRDPNKTRCDAQSISYFFCNVSYPCLRFDMRTFDSGPNAKGWGVHVYQLFSSCMCPWDRACGVPYL